MSVSDKKPGDMFNNHRETVGKKLEELLRGAGETGSSEKLAQFIEKNGIASTRYISSLFKADQQHQTGVRFLKTDGALAALVRTNQRNSSDKGLHEIRGWVENQDIRDRSDIYVAGHALIGLMGLGYGKKDFESLLEEQSTLGKEDDVLAADDSFLALWSAGFEGDDFVAMLESRSVDRRGRILSGAGNFSTLKQSGCASEKLAGFVNEQDDVKKRNAILLSAGALGAVHDSDVNEGQERVWLDGFNVDERLKVAVEYGRVLEELGIKDADAWVNAASEPPSSDADLSFM